MKNHTHQFNKLAPILIAIFMFCFGATDALAEASQSSLYVPLIGISLVPDPLVLPAAGGTVTYHYAVKNFLSEATLTNIRVSDNQCNSIKFVTGDDNNDARLDSNETWRYICATTLSTTTLSVATVTGSANNIIATHQAYATVIVGSTTPAPIVSIINITKIAYPLSLPSEGGKITYTYKVNNPGIVPLSNVTVVDDKCSRMSGKLGDTNGNDLLDMSEVWIYTCTTGLNQTTTNTVRVMAYSNGLKAMGSATLTVMVDNPIPGFLAQPIPNLPETGVNPYIKVIAWTTLSTILVALVLFSVLTQKNKQRKIGSKPHSSNKNQYYE